MVAASTPVVDPSVTAGRLTTGAVIVDDAGRRRHDRRLFMAVGGAFALAAIAFIAWMTFEIGGMSVTTDVDDIGEGVAAGIAAVACALASRRSLGRLRWAWLLLGASAAAWCLGETAWSVYEVGLGYSPPVPSVADIGFLASIPLAIAGISCFASAARGTSTGLGLWLDRAIVALSLLFLGWELGLGDVFSQSGSDAVSSVVSVAYPVGDILIGTVLLLAIRRATEETYGRLLLLLGGLAANAIADSAFVYVNLTGPYGPILDSGWVVGYLMIALAALWPSRAADRVSEKKPIDLWQLTLPWVAVLAGGLSAVLAALQGRSLDVVATVLAGVVITLLMARQVMAHQESLGLLIESRQSAATLEDVIVHAPLGMVRIAPDLTVLEVNPSFCAMLHTSAESAVSRSIDQFFPADELVLVTAELAKLRLRQVDSVEIEVQGTRGDGVSIWLHWTATAVDDRAGEIEYFLVMFGDISERRSTEDALKQAYAELESLVKERTAELRTANQRLSTEAISDPLTGLYNRRYLADFVEREVSRTRRAGTKIVFVMIDIDHFKRVNDTFGHDAGDDVLKAVSTFLRAQIRHEDLAFRYGGEEFLIVLPCISLDGIRTRIDLIHTRASEVHVQNVSGEMWPITISAGVAMFPDDGQSADAVIRVADHALYQAKSEGRDRVVYNAVLA